jgi:hypothetical protein
VAFFKAQAVDLLARGEHLIAGSPEKDKIEAFKRDEDIWRSLVTVWKNHFVSAIGSKTSRPK